MSGSLNELVRDQILAEGPDIASEQDWVNQAHYEQVRDEYIEEVLDSMRLSELLERISDALAKAGPP
jgi:hypothetical protein